MNQNLRMECSAVIGNCDCDKCETGHEQSSFRYSFRTTQRFQGDSNLIRIALESSSYLQLNAWMLMYYEFAVAL